MSRDFFQFRVCLVLLVEMVVLKGIPSILTPELLYALAKMGHGDELGKQLISSRPQTITYLLMWLLTSLWLGVLLTTV